jgi:23S rRNA (uracil1939-C5)-methyltransferase
VALCVGTVVELEVEKGAAGGRMLCRHQGQVVLVWGAIPGERVRARIDRVGKGVAFGDTEEVIAASPDRRPGRSDWRCGGNVLSHVSYPRQLRLKAQIIQDAFGRIGRIPFAAAPEVAGSPEEGYRMRARLHARDGRLGFYREGSHELCDAAATRQLLESSNAWIAFARESLQRQALAGVAAIEIAENVGGDQRACHLELHAGVDAAPYRALADGLIGLSAQRADRAAVHILAGLPIVSDTFGALTLRRDVRAFFQGNRFLLESLVGRVAAVVPPDRPIVDLYAGVGLFGLALAASGARAVTLVEGDPISGADLEQNARPFDDRARVERRSVELFLEAQRASDGRTFIVDPPRTGMSRDAVAGIIRSQPSTLVYVSCDVATLARDARLLLDAGYTLAAVDGMDLFPNTAHVETVALFRR